MDAVRFGLSVRALRRRRHLTQAELGRRSGSSRSAIGRVERGEADRFTARRLGQILAVLDAHLSVRAIWHGEELDRLLDADHAQLVEIMARRLTAAGWKTHVEVTFHVRGERGSIDLLAVHDLRSMVVVVEVKSVVPDIQSMLASLDRKVRLAQIIAVDRGLVSGQHPETTVSRLLVLPDDRTARRRIDRHQSTFARALPARTIDVRRWLSDPSRPLAGLLFLSDGNQAGARQRVAGARPTLRDQDRPAPAADAARDEHLTILR